MKSVQRLGWPVAVAVVLGGYLLLPANGIASAVVYHFVGVAATVMIVLGVRRHRPSRPGPWWWMAGGQASWVVGDVIYTIYDLVLHQSPFPSIADVFYLASYPMLLIGLALVVRSRGRGFDLAGALDAGIVATGLGLLSWTFLIRPIVTDGEVALLERVVSTGYPAADILLLAMLAWLVATGGARTASYGFLAAAVLLLLASDVSFSMLTSYFSYDGGLVDLGWLLSYALWAAAAWHPSMRRLGEPGPVSLGSRPRLLALGVTMLITPGMLLIQGLTGAGHVDWPAASIGGAILCVLSLARFTGLVGQLRRQTDQLAGMALRDEVTGLGNRRALEQRLAADLTDPRRPACLVLIDLDNFHEVNDRYGRAAGDALLAAVADRLRPLGPDGELTRVGGDEFALLLHPRGETTIGDAADPIRRLLSRPLPAAGRELLVQASIGIADAADVTDPAELLRRADVAAHAARLTGAGTAVRYHAALDERADEQARIGAALRAALDAGHFRVHYQPIVHLADERLAGVEALVRWQHPTLGTIGPDGFIPVAEGTGLIVELGAWVMREACAQVVRWDGELGAAAPGRVSVNVSPRQLAEPGFADTVAGILTGTGLLPARLTIEVTESAVIGGGAALDNLWAVHALGVRVALDDFGTGQSSLGLLRDCPVDVVKVDRSFVAALSQGGRDSAIVAGLIGIIDGLGADAVAEGIEEPGQAEHLRRLGYGYGQGYLFGRPALPADLAIARLSRARG